MHAKIIRLPQPSQQVREPNLSELVARARAGEEPAQAELFRRHVERVYGFVRRLMPDATDHDDIVQDVFVQAMESLHRLREAEAFSGWLRGIAIHIVKNRVRKRRLLSRLGLHRSSLPEALAIAELVSPGAPPDVLVELNAVYRTVAKLDPNLRTALILRRVEGLSVAAVAEQLGRSLSTTKRWLASAESQLALELGQGRHE
ncbi:MAG: sigma-70 family RNA polymerase sigma factor [Myxococcales bacterium]|nr:sigma-70 family RNA polymerase sigma factor [Myxococcales bacterium]